MPKEYNWDISDLKNSNEIVKRAKLDCYTPLSPTITVVIFSTLFLLLLQTSHNSHRHFNLLPSSETLQGSENWGHFMGLV